MATFIPGQGRRGMYNRPWGLGQVATIDPGGTSADLVSVLDPGGLRL